jgi:hypothetical protein
VWKKIETISTASTTAAMDDSTRAILYAMEIQSEIFTKQIEILTLRIEKAQRIADMENKKLKADIQLLGKNISKMNSGHDATTELEFESPRKYVSVNITSNGARNKLKHTRQYLNESVRSYMRRFRYNLNELICALGREIRDPTRRAFAINLETEQATKIFIVNLVPEIEIHTSVTRPKNLQEAQAAAFEAELLIREIQCKKSITIRRTNAKNLLTR